MTSVLRFLLCMFRFPPIFSSKRSCDVPEKRAYTFPSKVWYSVAT